MVFDKVTSNEYLDHWLKIDNIINFYCSVYTRTIRISNTDFFLDIIDTIY